MTEPRVEKLMELAWELASKHLDYCVTSNNKAKRDGVADILRAAIAEALDMGEPVACRYRYHDKAKWVVAQLPAQGDDTSDVQLEYLYAPRSPK